MSLRFATLQDPCTRVCAACRERKRLLFEAYDDERPGNRWQICYRCFRLTEDQLQTALKREAGSTSPV